MKDYNVIIDGKKVFDQPVKNDLRTYYNIQKITTGQGDDYTTGCLLHYLYFKEHFNMIAKDLRKQEELDSNPEEYSSFTGNLDQPGNTLFNFEEAKETILIFHK